MIKFMKNLLLTYFILSISIIPASFAQNEIEEEKGQIEQKEKVTKDDQAPVQLQPKEDVKNETTLDSLKKPDSNAPKFGSKEHRSKVEEAPSRIESTENILLKTCLALAAVIAVILLIFSILKKVNGRLSNTGSENPLRVKNKLMIDSKNYLALVRVYEEELLVSVGPNGTTLLTRYALVEKEEAEGTDFENILNSEGKAVIPADLDNFSKGIDMKPIRELKKNDSQ